MHTDKHPEAHAGKEATDSANDTPERKLSWLLDMDLSEPEERLFAVEQASQIDNQLTDYELEVASRPMTRGADDADDLATYVQEEIVMSSDGQSSDIYGDDSSTPVVEDDAAPTTASGEPMAIDHSRDFAAGAIDLPHDVTDGDDILGLSDDDDMGEAFLVIKRVKAGRQAEQDVPAAGEHPAVETAPADAAQVEDQSGEDTEHGDLAREDWLSTPALGSAGADQGEASDEPMNLAADVAAAGDAAEDSSLLPQLGELEIDLETEAVLDAGELEIEIDAASAAAEDDEFAQLPDTGELEGEAEAIAAPDAGEIESENSIVRAAEGDSIDDWLATSAGEEPEMPDLDAPIEYVSPTAELLSVGDGTNELAGLPEIDELDVEADVEAEAEAIAVLDAGELEFEPGLVAAAEDETEGDWLSSSAGDALELEQPGATGESITLAGESDSSDDIADEFLGLAEVEEQDTPAEAIAVLDAGELEFEAEAGSAADDESDDDWLSGPVAAAIEPEEIETSGESHTLGEESVAAHDADMESSGLSESGEPDAEAETITALPANELDIEAGAVTATEDEEVSGWLSTPPAEATALEELDACDESGTPAEGVEVSGDSAEELPVSRDTEEIAAGAGADEAGEEPAAVAASEDESMEDLLSASATMSSDAGELDDGIEADLSTEQSEQDGTAAAAQTASEPPVLRLVRATDAGFAADQEPTDTADSAQEGDDAGLVAESFDAADDDLLGYIAAVPPPVDEQEFDAYLLRGRQLQNPELGFDDLTLGPPEGEEGYDVAPGNAIDYHSDFEQFTGFPGDAVANVTPMIPDLLDELTLFIGGRLASLGLAAGSVQAELKLAGCSDSAEQLLIEGFEPIVTVCPLPIASLQQMRQVEVDVIFVRLVQGSTGQLCNRLFDPEFARFPDDGAVETSIESAEQDDVLAANDDVESVVPQEPLFAADTLNAISESTLQSDDADIDDIFTGPAEPDKDSDADLSLLGTDPDSDSVEEQAESFNVFGDDPLADESDFENDVAAFSSDADIDALFDSLDPGTGESGEFAGLDIDEVAKASGNLHSVDVSETVPELEPESEPESKPELAMKPASELQPEPGLEPELTPETEPVEAADVAIIPTGIKFSQASPGGGEIFADFLEAFIEEGSSELEKLEDAVALWEKDAASESAFANVGRILHTLKGIAKGVGLQFYSTLIHNFETLLGALPKPEAGAEGDYFRIVNTWLDACVRGLDHIQDEREDIACELPQIAGQPLQDEVSALPGVGEVSAPQEPVEEAPRQPASAEAEATAKQLSNKIADDGAKVLAAQQSVRITSEKLDHLLNLSNQAQQLSVRTAQSVTRSKRASTEMQSRLASVRSHIAAIADRALRSVAAKGVQPGAPMDALEMDQYSELQEAANILGEGVEDLADLVDFATRQNTQVEALLKQQTKVISSIGTSIRGARVVPVSRLIPGLRRLVRTVSVELGKTVSFKVLNELGTLDRDDYARCQTILDHMVRNALDHGIEPADERRAAGKPVDGQVTIDIRKAGADAIITLTDDGRGVDPQKMRDSAVRKGLDVDVDALSDAEAARLIFHKGFSTADSISQISGRGVGMDIVLNELQEMGGDIQIDSIPGRGTSFHIRVPSSVTVNGALLVSAGKQSYAIPLGGLISVEQVPVDEFFAAVQNNSLLTFGGLECEPAYLATLCQSGDSLDAKTWQHNVPVIIAGSPERYMAVAIDDVEEALELVIRSLGTQFSSVPGVAGAATTAAGEAIVALDLNLLVASVGAGDQSSLHVDTPRDEGLLVMVVDDSRTQRKVATSQLETVGVETITAENGAVAIDTLNAADRLPDIILMDVEMPVKDGIQALREMRKSVRYGHVPVIMITSRTGLKHRAMAQAAGCNGYMGKPFNFRMLIGQINQLTGQRLQLS